MDMVSEFEKLKKRVEFLESIVLQNNKKTEEPNPKRDKTRFMMDNKIYPKNRFVLAVVEKYIKQNNPTYSELAGIFDKSIQGSLNVVLLKNQAENIKDSKKRYFMDSPFKLKDGSTIVVCTQWGIFNIMKFEKVATNLGFKFDKIML